MSNKHPTEELKLKAIAAFQSGTSAIKIADIFGYDRVTIHRWVRESNAGKNMARKSGSGRPSKISEKNAKKILNIICKPASKYGFETDLWNSSRIRQICRKELKLKVSRMAVWRVLVKFDQSFKKVQKQYYETDVKLQEEWKKKTLPKIQRTVKKYRAILYFEDESNIALSPVMGKSWGPIGQKIVHKVTGNRGSVSAISAISVDGRLIFNLFDKGKRFNSQDIINFLEQMLNHHKRRHLVVVMDQASCHKSKKTKEYVESQKRLHVFYLPPRSPELNPDEQVWAHLKNHDLKSHQETNERGLKRLVRRKLNGLARDEKKLRGIFKRCDNSSIFLPSM